MEWLQAKSFLIQETQDNSTLIIHVPAVTGTPDNAVILYDGRDHALLKRNKNSGLILDFIAPSVQKKLYQCQRCVICEQQKPEDKIKQIYEVSMHKAKKINVSLYKARKTRT